MKKIVVLLCIILFLVPFFWFQPQQMDLGGDASRLYFYDPFVYLNNYALYSISSSGLGLENIGFFMIPFTFILLCFRHITSVTFLIAGFHGMSLAFSFLFSYLTVRELLYKTFKKHLEIIEVSAVFSGLFYLFSPSGVQGWDKVIFTHNQVFLNPLIFFLLLQYVLSTNFLYLILSILITFIFAPNFSLASAPQIFSFYPITLLFLFIYRVFILKKHIIWNHIVGAFLLFLGLHAFDLIPIIKNTFSVGSNINNAVFTDAGKLNRGLSYFTAIAPNIKVTYNMMMWPQMIDFAAFPWLYFVFPGILLVGLWKNHTRVFLLVGIFFLISFFLVSANITHFGFAFYAWLFTIPGFSMFRNYYGQWEFLFLFFYTIVLGYSFYYTFLSLKPLFRYILGCGLTLLIVYTSLPFINGSLVNKVLWQSNNVHIFFSMDPVYENFLSYVRNLPIDGKVVTLPLTDPAYQILAGKDGGAYQGPSTIGYLTGKKDFAGYDEFSLFADPVMNAFKGEDVQSLTNIFSLLNIKYLFYNSDLRVYDNYFPGFPYSNVRNYMPTNQAGYKKLIGKLPFALAHKETKYSLYSIQDKYYIPHIYIPKQLITVGLSPADWNLALHFYQVPSNRIAFTSPSDANQPQDIFKADNVDIYRNIEKDYPVATAYPDVKWSLNSLIYPFIIWREKHQLHKFKANDDSYTDQLLVVGSKRISEINQWALLLQLRRNITSLEQLSAVYKEPSGIAQFRMGNYNYWETSLSRYTQTIQEAITITKRSQLDENWKQQKQIHIKEVLKSDYSILNKIISTDSNLSVNDQKYLLHLVDIIFTSFDQQLLVPEYSPYFINYSVSSTENGVFLPLLQKNPTENADVSADMLYKDIIDPVDNKISDNNFTHYEPLNIAAGKSSQIAIQVSPHVIQSISPWQQIDTNSVFAADESFIPKPLSWDRQISAGYYREITNLKQQTTYLLSFRYNTYGKNVKFALLLEKNGGSKSKVFYFPVFSQIKNTRKEMVFNAVINSDNAEKVLFVTQGTNNAFTLNSISFTNISVIELPAQPDLLFKNTQPKTLLQSNTPKIVFTKVNPVTYIVHVRDATKPYNLILSDSFNNDWKVYLSNNSQVKKPVIANYFNGDIQETQPFNSFLSIYNIMDLLKSPVASKNHYIVNGYSNGWTVNPTDVGGKKDYTLVIETDSQRYFYIGAIISLLTLFIVLVLLLREIMKTNMRYSRLALKTRDNFYYRSLAKQLVNCESVLDVGCGENSPLGKVPKKFYSEGVDIFTESLNKSKHSHIHDTYKNSDIRKIKQLYKAKSFDAVIALDVIEHFEKDQAYKLIKDMETIARKKVILLTPNGFYKQDEIGGNPYQVHLSGWSTKDLEQLGYTVFGLRGLKYLKGDYATITLKPWFFWGVISFISEPLLYRISRLSYHLFAVKEFENEKTL